MKNFERGAMKRGDNTAKTMPSHGFRQVELTNFLLNNLSQFNLKPTTKLVLLYLSGCYNPKHADVFPKQKTIADRMGISERSVISAIQELHKEGLIISERKYSNRYTFTSRILSQAPQNKRNNQSEEIADKECKSFTSQDENFAPACNRTRKEQEKEQTSNDVHNGLGGNVYSMEEAQILKDYAIKHNARNVNAYVAKLRNNGSDKTILKEYRKKAFISLRAANTLKETQQYIDANRALSETAVDYTESEAWLEFGRKIGLRKG